MFGKHRLLALLAALPLAANAAAPESPLKACRAEADCPPPTAPTGGARLRACNPLDFAADCKGKGCGQLNNRIPTLLPASNISVCD